MHYISGYVCIVCLVNYIFILRCLLGILKVTADFSAQCICSIYALHEICCACAVFHMFVMHWNGRIVGLWMKDTPRLSFIGHFGFCRRGILSFKNLVQNIELCQFFRLLIILYSLTVHIFVTWMSSAVSHNSKGCVVCLQCLGYLLAVGIKLLGGIQQKNVMSFSSHVPSILL